MTERNNGFFETSFLPGRRFTGPADFNAQLAGFLARANARKRRSLQGACGRRRVGADRAAMGPLPPIEAATIGWRNSLVLPRDYYVRLDTCDYSVHPARDRAAGRGDRGSGHGAHPPRRGAGRRARAVLGAAADHHRPGAPQGRRRDAPGIPGPQRGRAGPGGRRGAGTRPVRLRPGASACDDDDGEGRRRDGGQDHHDGTRGGPTQEQTLSEIAYLTRALKAPTLRDSVERLAERARAEGWTHEQFLAACLQREVSARDSHGGEGRIRAARFPARKALEEFDFDHQRSLKRETIAHLGTLDFITAKENAIFLGPPGTGKTMLAIGLGIRACQAGHRVAFATAAEWVARLAAAHQQAGCRPRSPNSAAPRW